MRPRGTALVVDDQPLVRELMADALAAAEYDVITATNGARALDLVRDRHPDVIVLDMMMPVVDGFGFLEAYQRGVAANTAPVVVVSATLSSDVVRRLHELGVSAWLSKPFDLDALVDCVRRLVQQRPVRLGARSALRRSA
jgi:DNA-binding response OmpR family regulator